jgi:hypothetical protein
MTALSDSLATSQARAVAALAKSYVQGRIEPEAVREALSAVGLTDAVDTDQWLATLDVIREHGAAAPGEARGPRWAEGHSSGEVGRATDAQVKLIAKLADERKLIAPQGPFTMAQASQIIEQIKNGSYNPDDWAVQF